MSVAAISGLMGVCLLIVGRPAWPQAVTTNEPTRPRRCIVCPPRLVLLALLGLFCVPRRG